MNTKQIKQLKSIAAMYDKNATINDIRDTHAVIVIKISAELIDNAKWDMDIYKATATFVNYVIRGFVKNKMSLYRLCELIIDKFFDMNNQEKIR